MELIKNEYKESSPATPRPTQITIEEALRLTPIDLLKDEDQAGRKLLSRADIILVYTFFTDLKEFLRKYQTDAEEGRRNNGYKYCYKPHFYLKNLID